MSGIPADSGVERPQGIPKSWWTDDHSGLFEALGVEVAPELLALAMTHRSYANENGGLPNNERLEFLGDSVLGLAVTERLYAEYPDRPEGDLARFRANLVNMYTLAEVARGLGPGGLGKHLLLGRGEMTTGGRDKQSILADSFEALLGAIHLDRGPEVSRRIVLDLFTDRITAVGELGAGLDWKTSLQELVVARHLDPPRYYIAADGPAHQRHFFASCIVGDRCLGKGEGRTRKESEQIAARRAYRLLEPSSVSGDLGALGTAMTPEAQELIRPNGGLAADLVLTPEAHRFADGALSSG